MNERENYLRAIEFRTPEWIPCQAFISPLTWHTYREDLEELVLRHPRIFPDYDRDPSSWDDLPPGYRGEYLRDNWGCLWFAPIGGLEGQVVESPLADWKALDSYRPPDPRTKDERGEKDWDATRREIDKQKRQGRIAQGWGGRLFDRMYFLRGFDNLMIDIATDDPHLPQMIEMLTEYQLEWIKPYLEMGVDVMAFHTDIGTQNGLMISPKHFRQYLKPMFTTIFSECRAAGAAVLLSSDGRLLEIVDDLVGCGVSAHDTQVRANTLEGIKTHYSGKLCAVVDLDRQLFPFCTPREIHDHVRECVEMLYAPEGGLMLIAAVYDEITPLVNIAALFDALEENCFDL